MPIQPPCLSGWSAKEACAPAGDWLNRWRGGPYTGIGVGDPASEVGKGNRQHMLWHVYEPALTPEPKFMPISWHKSHTLIELLMNVREDMSCHIVPLWTSDMNLISILTANLVYFLFIFLLYAFIFNKLQKIQDTGHFRIVKHCALFIWFIFHLQCSVSELWVSQLPLGYYSFSFNGYGHYDV